MKVRIMLRYGIAQFVGSWISASGFRLRIKKVRKDQASVDFLDPRGASQTMPMRRWWKQRVGAWAAWLTSNVFQNCP